MIRAVVDPGVLISGLIAPAGVTSEIIRAWQRGLFEMVVSPQLLDVLASTLLRPKFRRWITENDAVAFVEILRLAAVVVDDPPSPEPPSRDPSDDYLIALARAAGASVIVSGDGDLLSIDGAEPPVVTPRRLLTGIEEI